jgi:trans-aconitate 2-methyltransferase
LGKVTAKVRWITMLREWDATTYDSLPLPRLRRGRRTLERLSFTGDNTVFSVKLAG